MKMADKIKIDYLHRAALCYVLAGLGFICFGFPFWFLNAVDKIPEHHRILPNVILINDLLPLTFEFWEQLISAVTLFLGAYSLWKIGEPTGYGTRRNFLFVSMAGGISYFLACWMPFPFAPLGAFLNGTGMVLVGIACLRSRIWVNWKRYVPLFAGLFPFLFMFPIRFLTGARPAAIIGLWGFPWILLGIACLYRSYEVKRYLAE